MVSRSSTVIARFDGSSWAKGARSGKKENAGASTDGIFPSAIATPTARPVTDFATDPINTVDTARYNVVFFPVLLLVVARALVRLVALRPDVATPAIRARVRLATTATLVGLLTGFLGVGGGFIVVPALLLGLALPLPYAAGTSLVVITITSATALAARTGVGSAPDWGVVLTLTLASALAAVAGARIANRADTRHLSGAFTVLVLAVAVYTAARAVPALL